MAGPAPGPAPVPLRSAAPAAVGVIDREAGTIAEALPSTVVPAVGVTPAVAVAPAIASAVVVTPAVAQGLDSAPQAVAESRASVPSPEPTVVAEAPGPTDPPGPAGAPSTRPAAEGPCGELRVVAEDRCTVAARAREGAAAAGTALREAQRSYDDHLQHADEADALADPRAVRSAKESAQHAFRAAREQSGSREALETAARTWLETINRINMEARDAAARATKARAAANALVTNLERLTAEADAARIAMEAAEEACVAARQAVAECEEEAAAAASAGAAAEAVRSPAVPPAPLASPEGALHYPEDEPELSPVALGEHEARVIRIVRGDRDALYRTAAELGGDDASARREWQVALTGLVDAVLAQAIDASLLDVPDSPAFWAPFTAAQRREIVAALASLGYRFDGVDAFVDGRIPSQRDLSLALGYAGLDPMRVRHWPTESEASRLLSGVRVAADEYLAGAAGGLRLSEMIDLLGRRADGLTDLWNEWGRVRPRLLAID